MAICTQNPASEYYADFILRYFYRSTDYVYELVSTQCVNFISQEYAITHAILSNIKDLNFENYLYSMIPKIYGLLDTTALESSGVLRTLSQPVLRATGRGVLIGFIDTGIDYTNPLFRNADGSTRILEIWDQTVDSFHVDESGGNEFQPFYGAIYDENTINQALTTDAPYAIVPTRDEDGHGTFMASVAAGKTIDQPSSFSGAAPESSLAVVKLKPAKKYLKDFFLIPDDAVAFQENDIMAGVSYLVSLSDRYRMPLVIYLGVGTSQGSHDGTSPLGQQLQNLTGFPPITAVIGAGNETGYQHHYYGNIEQDQAYDDVELRVGESGQGFCMELWAREPEIFTIGFISPSGEVIERIPLALGKNITIPFRLDATKVTVNYVNYETDAGSQLIFMRFQNPSPGIWHIRVYPMLSATGQFHIWLPMEQFLPNDTVFLKPDPYTTIADPGNASMPLTVGAYNHTTGGIDIHSSRGFTRTGLIKPELAAPGVDVQGAGLPPASRANTNNNDPTNIRFSNMTGTSIAAAITAGAVADIFTWAIVDRNDLALSSAAAQSMLIRGASRNPAYSYPSKEWGFGTLDLYQAFLVGRE